MTAKRLVLTYVAITLVISVPFVIIHVNANPDDAPITPLQHVVAALANFFGPWGVAIVRLVDFPNAGLRSFSWTTAVGMTLIGGLLAGLGVQTKTRFWQYFFLTFWAVFIVVWFYVGLTQIADGLL